MYSYLSSRASRAAGLPNSKLNRMQYSSSGRERLHWLAAAVALIGTAGPLRAAPAITAPEVSAHVKYLASDALEGRGSGTPGGRKAAEYIEKQFRSYGLKPAGLNGGYYQPFDVTTGIRLADGNSLRIEGSGGSTSPAVEKEWLPVSFSANGSVTGELVFAGYGISRPELKFDDYAGLDVHGKIVVVLRRTPDGDDHGKFAEFAPLRYKATVAREKGAAGILFITGPQTSEKEDLGHLEPDGSFSDAGIPAAIVRRSVVEPILKASGKELAAAQTALAHGERQSVPLAGARAALTVNVRRERGETANVLGLLEGSDPKLKDEVVVIGAHYDHLGMGGPESLNNSSAPAIHHGADDNASGTAGVMELAEYFAGQKERPKRSLLFMAFSGEEMGLLGSAYFVRQPTLPLARIVGMVNLDMIGRLKNDVVQVLGTKTSPDWAAILEGADRRVPLTLRSSGSGFGASDQQSFYAKDVPVLFFFTGVHADYHRPTDTWEKINTAGEAKVLRFVADVVERIADLPARPQFVRAADPEPSAGPSFSVYLGSIPDYSEEGQGVTLTGVREGSPAEKAGLKAGDVIVEFAGKKIANVYDYTYALRDAKAGVPVAVVVLRKGARVKLTVVPAARQ